MKSITTNCLRDTPDLSRSGALRAELKQTPDPHRAFQRLFADAAIARWVDGAHDTEYSAHLAETFAATSCMRCKR
jgi:hypothetical protein